MPYILEECRAGKTVETDRHFTYHYGKHWSRGDIKAPTEEAQKRANYRKQLKDLRRIMNANFKDGEDCLITASFRPEERPEGSRELLDIMQHFCRSLRTEYKRCGYELKYIYVMEIGKKGAMHAHMVVTWNNLSIFWKCWRWGAVNVEPLHTDGQYAAIAEYFLKYSRKTEETEGKLLGKHWYGSRNLIRPVPSKTVIHAGHWRTRIHERAGYYLDKNSVRDGISELTGMPYLTYTLIKMRC